MVSPTVFPSLEKTRPLTCSICLLCETGVKRNEFPMLDFRFPGANSVQNLATAASNNRHSRSRMQYWWVQSQMLVKVVPFCRKGLCSFLQAATRSPILKRQRVAVERISALVLRLMAKVQSGRLDLPTSATAPSPRRTARPASTIHFTDRMLIEFVTQAANLFRYTN